MTNLLGESGIEHELVRADRGRRAAGCAQFDGLLDRIATRVARLDEQMVDNGRLL